MLLLLVVTCNFTSYAVEPGRFQFSLDFSLSAGFSQNFKTLADSPVGSDKTYSGFLSHATLLYNINKKFTTGIGIGLDTYTLAPNAVPVLCTFRHRPIQKIVWDNFYYFTNLGYSIPFVDTKTFAAGWLWDLGIGWQKNFRKHFGLNVHLGYGLKEFRTYYGYADSLFGTIAVKFPNKYSIVRNSIAIGIGIVI